MWLSLAYRIFKIRVEPNDYRVPVCVIYGMSDLCGIINIQIEKNRPLSEIICTVSPPHQLNPNLQNPPRQPNTQPHPHQSINPPIINHHGQSHAHRERQAPHLAIHFGDRGTIYSLPLFSKPGDANSADHGGLRLPQEQMQEGWKRVHHLHHRRTRHVNRGIAGTCPGSSGDGSWSCV